MADDLPSGATPIDPDEAEGLLHSHVTTRAELDELEELNIQAGLEWAQRRLRGRRSLDVLTVRFLYELHTQMFGNIWEWAGRVRRTDKNIGVDKRIVREEVRKLIEDARYWREEGVFPPDELAVRFHHRLVWIHPFVNGNGRHARMMADLIAQQAGRPFFTWGGPSLARTSDLRRAYIEALRQADRGDMGPLLMFARS